MVRYPALFVAYLLLQVVLFEKLTLFDLAAPHVFLTYLLYLPLGWPKWIGYLLAFVMGHLVSIFAPPYGAHAFTAVLLMGLRQIWVELIKPQVSGSDVDELKFETQSFGWQLFYAAPLLLVYELTYHILSDFGVTFQSLLKGVGSAAYTLAFLLVFFILFYKRTEK